MLIKKESLIVLGRVAIMLLNIMACSQAVAADCSTVTSNYVINPGNITVQRDVPVGSPLSKVIRGSEGQGYRCPILGINGVSAGLKSYLSATSIHVGNYAVFSTNIPGVGISIGSRGGFDYPGQWELFIEPGRTVTDMGAVSSTGNVNFYYQPEIQFFRIPGELTSGLLSGSIGSYIQSDVYRGIVDNTGPWGPEIPIIFGSGSIDVVACSINNSNIVVKLEDTSENELNAPGKTAKPKTFNIGLNCATGARVNAMLSATQNADSSVDGVLNLTGAGGSDVATGVGIQILYNSIPVALNTNLVLKTSAGGQETFPFTAQYYQTKPVVTPGSANATATLELTYQ